MSTSSASVTMPMSRSAPNSNFVSARMSPRVSAMTEACSKISSDSSRSCSATVSPTSSTVRSYETFSSCSPIGAFHAGV